jgi:hypothetical protein
MREQAKKDSSRKLVLVNRASRLSRLESFAATARKCEEKKTDGRREKREERGLGREPETHTNKPPPMRPSELRWVGKTS